MIRAVLRGTHHTDGLNQFPFSKYGAGGSENGHSHILTCSKQTKIHHVLRVVNLSYMALIN